MARPAATPGIAENNMRAALAEAELGRGRTHPNPIVGALVVRGGKIVAAGHHARAGGPHAEVVALQRAGALARGADLYVTLEPCNHHGRTPPCTEAILAAGIRRLFAGSIDPNPKVDGHGARRLREAGVEVVTGVLQAECDRAIEQWRKFITQGAPWVLLKAAVTLDGKLATAAGDSRWVSGAGSRELVHELRDTLDAIIVGVGTARADDPSLTARPKRVLHDGDGDREGGGPVRAARDPVRVVVDSGARLPPSARLLRQRSAAPTLVAVTSRAPATRVKKLEAAGAQILRCKRGRDGRVDLRDLLQRLAAWGLTSVLVEGGAALHGSFLRGALWDELFLFVAPKLAGKDGLSWAGFAGPRAMADALPVRWRALYGEACEPDLLLVARPVS